MRLPCYYNCVDHIGDSCYDDLLVRLFLVTGCFGNVIPASSALIKHNGRTTALFSCKISESGRIEVKIKLKVVRSRGKGRHYGADVAHTGRWDHPAVTG